MHVRREGKILRDHNRELSTALATDFTPIAANEEIERELARLALYDDLSRYGDNFLFCLAHIYTIAKTIMMARLADVGIYEFDRERAFSQFASRWPDARTEVELIRSLRPFYGLVTKRRPESLPFSFHGNEHRVARAVQAVRLIAETSAP